MARYGGNLVGINFILKLRLIFGFYYNFYENIWLKYAIKALLVAISVQYVYVATIDRITTFNDISEISRLVEYVIYIICSLQTEEEYLINYLSIDTIIDEKSYSRNTRTNIVKFLICYIVLLVFVCSLLYITLMQIGAYASIDNGFAVLYIVLTRFGIEIGRTPILMVFILLYFRVKIFCTKLRKDLLNNATAVVDWKKYVKIYIKILDTLEKTDWPIKFMMLVHLIIGFINVTSIQFTIIREYKGNQFRFDLKTINILSELLYKYAVLFYPSVIMEMITDQLDALKIEIADKMITCTCERRRSNLRELLKYFREHPMKYCICRAFQVYSRLPLGYVSLAATYLVCLLQFTHVLQKT